MSETVATKLSPIDIDYEFGGSTDQLELRQVAGLTSGSATLLPQGESYFSDSDDAEMFGFGVSVEGQRALLIPGSEPTKIDDVLVTEPIEIGDGVVQAGTGCFTIQPPRNGSEQEHAIEAARYTPRVIDVPTFSENPDEMKAQAWNFVQFVRANRDRLATRHRRLHPDPEELASRVSRCEPGLWERGSDHPLFTRFSIAYSTIPWEPHFDQPDTVPVDLYEPIQLLSCLPAVPVTANLGHGPFAIVGFRSAALACSRHAVLSLAALSAPGSVQFSIVTSEATVDDWQWTSSLPSSMLPNNNHGKRIALVDGVNHLESASFGDEQIRNREVGLILLAESMSEVPDFCATVVEITPDARCRVTNHLGEVISGVPIGVKADHAERVAADITVGLAPIDQ